MTRGLLDMPKVVMSKIMEDIGIKAILTLRKVCHDLKNFIDDVKPDAKLEEIKINAGNYDSISVLYKCSGRRHSVQYEKHREGCLVRSGNEENEVLLKNKNFVFVSLKDFEIASQYQKSVLKVFCVTGSNEKIFFMDKMHHILKSRAHRLKVKCFNAELKDQNQLISILRLLDSKSLTKLEINFYEDSLDIDRLIKLDYWKSIQHIIITTPVDLKYIQHFTHFSSVVASFRCDQFPNLIILKDIFLRSSGFETIHVYPRYIDGYDGAQSFIELLGEPIAGIDLDEGHNTNKWYYRVAATNEILEITEVNENFSSNIHIILSRRKENNIPQNAVIQN